MERVDDGTAQILTELVVRRAKGGIHLDRPDLLGEGRQRDGEIGELDERDLVDQVTREDHG